MGKRNVKNNCFYCQKEFMTWKAAINKGKGLFCSLSCSASSKNKARAKNPIDLLFDNLIIPENKNECWIYKKSKPMRYPRMVINGKRILAHRFSYQIHKGEIEPDMVIMHTCDNIKCCNPEHLLMGTTQDNVNDKINKGRLRVAFGENSGRTKLTNQQVKEIKIKIKEGLTNKEIAKEYPISSDNISNIRHNKSWTHIII